MVHDNIDISDFSAFCTLGTFSGGISTSERVIRLPSVLLIIDPLHLQAQPAGDFPDLVDVGKHLIRAEEVLVDDCIGGWREMTMVLA